MPAPARRRAPLRNSPLPSGLEAAPAAVAAGALENLALYFGQGCRHAASRARLLCTRLATDPDVDESLRAGARRLAVAIAASADNERGR